MATTLPSPGSQNTTKSLQSDFESDRRLAERTPTPVFARFLWIILPNPPARGGERYRNYGAPHPADLSPRAHRAHDEPKYRHKGRYAGLACLEGCSIVEALERSSGRVTERRGVADSVALLHAEAVLFIRTHNTPATSRRFD
ncbi:hypothetical protein DFH09DRAFT_1373265, partial [Mycena vulgaris]